MYKLLLISRYLRRRRIAWIALLAVTLCTAMVLIVISVMGGWLRMAKTAFHGLTGDVVVYCQNLGGFTHYQELIDDVTQLKTPDGKQVVLAAVPTIRTYGMLQVGSDVIPVQVVGYPPDQIGQVNRFPQSLQRQYRDPMKVVNNPQAPADARQQAAQQAETGEKHPSFGLIYSAEDYRDFLNRPNANKLQPEKWPGMIIGSAVLRGWSLPALARTPVKLTVVPTGQGHDFEQNTTPPSLYYWVVDESHFGVYLIDSKDVYVPFDALQTQLGMQAQTAEQDGQPIELPARASEVQIKLNPTIDHDLAIKLVKDRVNELQDHMNFGTALFPESWEEVQGPWMGAIEHEEILVVFLFSIISLVAVLLVFCIFYMIVLEKTRDIGIIKSVGASDGGVAGIFLGYGLAIGIVGGGLGLLAGYLVVHNINELHEWLGKAMGVKIWDAQTYMFDSIPNSMNGSQVSVIVAVAVLAAVLGSLLPAIAASRMHPVEALRWE